MQKKGQKKFYEMVTNRKILDIAIEKRSNT